MLRFYQFQLVINFLLLSQDVSRKTINNKNFLIFKLKMGCKDSKNLKREFQTSKFNRTTKGPDYQSKRRELSNDIFPQNSSEKISRLAPFYERLQDMYKSCGQDLKKFIAMIEERVSQIYIEISRQTLLDMNHEEIAVEQSKIIISEEILLLNLNILRVIGRNCNFEYDKVTFRELNQFQKNLVGYLKAKYPRGQQTFVSNELMNNFKEFDRINDLQYDILKNSNTYFGEANNNKIIIGIKLFINKLIDQCDNNFPNFQKLMQQHAFLILNQNNEKKSLNYKIGRKIPQNVSKYQNFDSDFFEIFSPHIFRVLIKWMEDLQQTITKTSQKISKKQSFKCYVGQRPLHETQKKDKLLKDQKKILFDYINQNEYSEIVGSLINKIEKLKPKLRQKNLDFMNQLDNFNQTLLKILNQADPRQKYIPTKQIQIIKYSSFNAKFVEYILAEKLVFAIKQLIEVGKAFISENMLNLDIIKFRVTDLMRCQVSGNKKQIIQVYKNLKNLEKDNKIQIIKVKNRLSTPLNDAMIIFTIQKSWIICEAQLILSEVQDKIDNKSKNTQLINHYFYQLQRSPYGIMGQIAILMTYKDSKISYENKITFNESNVDISNCKKYHRELVLERQKQQIPFICSKCSRFYRKSQNLFKVYQCKKCKILICSKCILKKNPELQDSFIMRDIKRQLQQKIDILSQSQKQKKQTLETKLKQTIKKNVGKKLTPKYILQIFQSQRIKFKEIFDNQKYNRSNIKKVSAQKLMHQLTSMYDLYSQIQIRYFLVANFLKGKSNFKFYSYDPKVNEIQNTFDFRQKYDKESYFLYSQFDMLLMMPPKTKEPQESQNLQESQKSQRSQKLQKPQDKKQKQSTSINQNHLFLFVTRQQLQAKMQNIKRLKIEGKINKEQNYQIISEKLKDKSQLVLDYRAIKKNKQNENQRELQYSDSDYYKIPYAQKKQFKYSSLLVYAQKLPDLKSAKKTVEFDDLGIQSKHLDYFNNIMWYKDIKELNISNNKIEDIAIILDKLESLQRFYFNDNYVKQLKFNKSLSSLEILNGTRNMIAKIQGLNNINQIKKLLLGYNKFKKFPQCRELKDLNVLNLKQNYLSKISNILTSDFSQLQQLIISGQFKEWNQNTIDQIVINGNDDDDDGNIFGFVKKIKNIFSNTNTQNQILIKNKKLKNFQSQQNQLLLKGKHITFQSNSLQKISMNVCSIDRIDFSNKQCLLNLKYLHLNGNKIKVLEFLRINQQKQNKIKDSFATNESDIDIKPIHNDSLIQLTLNYNQIQFLPVMKFSSLQILQLRNNKIKDIRSLQKQKMPELQSLDLSGNNFSKVCKLNFNKLVNLNLSEINLLQNADTLFNNESQLPILQTLSFSQSSKFNFSFNINQNNNTMTRLKQIKFQYMNFNDINNKEQTQAQFNIPSLQRLSFWNSNFNSFPILKLPLIKQLRLQGLEALSFKNIQKSQLKSVQDLYLNEIIQGKQNKTKQNNKNLISKSDKKYENKKYEKQLTCDFKFSQLKSLYIGHSTFASLNGLQINKFQKLDQLQLINITTKDGKIPKIKAPNLTYIKLEGFNIPNADSFISNNFPKVSTLFLQNNSIQTISDNILQTLLQVKILSLHHNKLKRFICSKQLNKLAFLDLSQNELISFPRIKAKNLTEIRWYSNHCTDLNELENCQLSALDQIDIQYCDLSNSQFPILNMVYLQKMRISWCWLSVITNLKYNKLPALRQLDLSSNKIKQLPIFHLPQLMILNLQNNQIQHLQDLKKCKLESLNELRISKNNITKIPNNLQFPKLKIFYCEHNIKIQNLPELEFSELQQLHMQHCNLVDISDFCKGDYKFLTSINMKHNKINYLPNVYMQSLRNACFDYNQIQDIDQFLTYSNLSPELNRLSFNHNKLITIPELDLPNLKAVFFRSNPLKQLDCFNKPQYPSLQGLYLKDTYISQLRNIKKFPQLQFLELRNCKLKNIDWLVQAAPNLPKLNMLDLRHCKITYVPNMDVFENIQILALDGNPIKYVDDLIQSNIFKKLKYITIGLDLDVDFDQFDKIRQKITDMNSLANVSQFNKINETQSDLSSLVSSQQQQLQQR